MQEIRKERKNDRKRAFEFYFFCSFAFGGGGSGKVAVLAKQPFSLFFFLSVFVAVRNCVAEDGDRNGE